MSQELMHHPAGAPPFAQQQVASQSINAGSVAVEQSRAVAEAQGQLTLAKKFPRDLNGAYAELMQACKLPALAQVAFYSLPRGGQTITGPSIRLAEEIARVYGNFQYGHRELSRDGEKSEVEVYAWDMEKNNYSKRQLTVMHVRDTRQGPQKLRDQKDIDDKIANVASKQVRGRILALVPKWLSEAAIAECRNTLSGNNEIPIEERVRRMTQAFAKYGVTNQHIEAKLGHSLDSVDRDEIVDLTGIFNAIKDGAKIADFFGADSGEVKEVIGSTTAKLQASAAEGVAIRQKEQEAAKAAEDAKTKADAEAKKVKKAAADAKKTEAASAAAATTESEGPAPTVVAGEAEAEDDDVF